MSLYVTELRRLGKRRFTRWMTLFGLLVLAAVVVGTFLTNEKIGPAQIAGAERAAEQSYQSELRFVEQFRADCERARTDPSASQPGQFPADCADINPPPRNDFQAAGYLPSTFDFRERFGETLTPLAAILAMIGFVVGASFVGAEWSTGGMMNLLLWRPKRLTVLLTKLAALVTGLVSLAVVSVAAWTASFWLIATFRGSIAKMTSGAWQSFALTGLRGIVLVLVAGTVGFALASLGRHTALALGGAIGLAVVGQFGLGMLLAVAGVRFLEAWLLPTHLLAWMDKKVTLEDYRACEFSSTGECRPDRMDITWQDSSILLVVGTAIALGLAMWTMRRRDIT